MSSKLIEVPCPVCGSTESTLVMPVRDYTYRITPDAFGVRRCRVCRVGFLSPRPTAADIGAFYPSEFYWSFEQAGTAPLSADEVLVRRAPQIASKLQRLEHLRPGSLLDIGAMKGEFLHAAQGRGWRVEGVEFSDSVPRLFEVPIRYGEFLEMQFAPGSFDCVTMWAVLEHVYDPSAYVRKVGQLLAGGGRFLGVVTNFNSVQAHLLRADDYPRHLTLFTKSSLRRLFAESGLQPVRFWTDQKLFGGKLQGALTYAVKRNLGYSTDEVFYEMRDQRDGLAFCCKFRGRASEPMKWVSRVDKALTWLPEQVLDLAGFGFNLGFEARKVAA